MNSIRWTFWDMLQFIWGWILTSQSAADLWEKKKKRFFFFLFKVFRCTEEKMVFCAASSGSSDEYTNQPKWKLNSTSGLAGYKCIPLGIFKTLTQIKDIRWYAQVVVSPSFMLSLNLILIVHIAFTTCSPLYVKLGLLKNPLGEKKLPSD